MGRFGACGRGGAAAPAGAAPHNETPFAAASCHGPDKTSLPGRTLAPVAPAEATMSSPLNHEIADRLDEIARLLADQGANPYRVRAYHRAANLVRALERPVDDILLREGLEGLDALPGVGESIARLIRDLLRHGRSALLARLRGETDPLDLLTSVPGIGRDMAARLHHDLGIDTLEELELAAHDGRLANVKGIGEKRLAAIRATLAERLARVRSQAAAARPDEPPVSELLDVDREYREKSARGALRTIAPRRMNPEGRAWLPILHTARGPRHYTALYSNTPRAHQLGRNRDWVVLYLDGESAERQWTAITAERGPLTGRRIVRGREAECAEFYRARTVPAS